MSKITLLKAKGKNLCKEFSPDGSKSYDDAKMFEVMEVECNNLQELQATLAFLKNQQDVCIIRGTPVDEFDAPVRRLSYDDPITGDKATFNDDPVSWVMLDMDDVECPADYRGLHRVAQAISTLPDVFHQTSCVYQFSNSEGVKGWDEVKVHLWFWLEEPRTSKEVKRWLKKQMVKADLSVFTAVQPHYTASPIFNGVSDPVEDRVGIFKLGNEHLNVEIIPEPVIEMKETPTAEPSSAVAKVLMEDIQSKVNAATPGNRHKTYLEAALIGHGYAQEGYLDWFDVQNYLLSSFTANLANERGTHVAQKEINDIFRYAESHASPRKVNCATLNKKLYQMKKEKRYA